MCIRDRSEARRGGIEADPRTRLFAQAAIKNTEVEATGEAVQDGPHLAESRGDLLHVPPHHHERQAARRGEGLNVLLGSLRVALVAQGQRRILEQPGSLATDVQKAVARKPFEH